MKHLKAIIFISLTFCCFSCFDFQDDDPIIPEASFVQDRNFIEPSESVSFTNESGDAISYEWDFGDGNQSTEESPTHVFQSLGTFQVMLTATSETGETHTFTSEVVVGERWPTAIFLSAFNPINGSGDPWDEDDSGPDVYFGFSLSNGQVQNFIKILDDIQPNTGPKAASITSAQSMKFSDQNWKIVLIDNDDPDTDLNESELMIEIEFNPFDTNNKSYETGRGSISIDGSATHQYIIQINYEIR